MRLYRERCILLDMGDVRTEALGIDLRENQPIYIGRFIDRDRLAYKPTQVEAE